MSYGYILVCIKCHLGTLFESVILVHFNSLSYGTFFVCHMVKLFIEWYLGMILTECLCLRAVFVYKLFYVIKVFFVACQLGSFICLYALCAYFYKHFTIISIIYICLFFIRLHFRLCGFFLNFIWIWLFPWNILQLILYAIFDYFTKFTIWQLYMSTFLCSYLNN